MCGLQCMALLRPYPRRYRLLVSNQHEKGKELPAPLSTRWASNLRSPGRGPRALPVHYATDVAIEPKSNPPSYNGINHIAGGRDPPLPVEQEQQLFMSWPALSPPRSATGREDGAHWGGAPVNFRVCSHFGTLVGLRKLCLQPSHCSNTTLLAHQFRQSPVLH